MHSNAVCKNDDGQVALRVVFRELAWAVAVLCTLLGLRRLLRQAIRWVLQGVLCGEKRFLNEWSSTIDIAFVAIYIGHGQLLALATNSNFIAALAAVDFFRCYFARATTTVHLFDHSMVEMAGLHKSAKRNNPLCGRLCSAAPTRSRC